MKVLVIIPSPIAEIMPEVLEALVRQDYPDFDWTINVLEPIQAYPDRRNISFNSTRNLNEARTKALKSDIQYFITLDSDVVMPDNAITEFMKQSHKDIAGGWYPMAHGESWVAGKWIANNTLWHFKKPEQSLIKVDMVGLGCLMLSRKALTELEFRDGIDKEIMDEFGEKMYMGPCAAFSDNAQNKGYNLYMNGSVICQHLTREIKHAA